MKSMKLTVEVKDGKLNQEIKTEGFQGGECIKASEPFQQMGGTVLKQEMTVEGQGCAHNFVPASAGI